MEWIADAQFANRIEDVSLYETNAIKSFLGNKNHDIFFISSSKGMGKTLILRKKRKRIMDKGGYILVPQEKSEYDILRIPIIKESVANLCQSVQYWQKLFELSLYLSSLKAIDLDISEFNMPDLKLPSDFVDYFMSRVGEKLYNYYNNFNSKIRARFKEDIRSGIAIFVDAIDQSISSHFLDARLSSDIDRRKVWVSSQIGFLKAAWELQRENQHLKIFCTFRSEAIMTYDGEDLQNIRGSTLTIDYNKEDLRRIVETIAGKKLESYTGIKYIRNRLSNKNETIYDYIYRHTFYTPRCFMEMMAGIDNILGSERGGIKDNNRTEKRIKLEQLKTSINKTSRNLMKSNVTARRIIIDDISDVLIKRLVSKYFYTPILDRNDINVISEKIGRYENIEIGFFTILYNLGLLGEVVVDPCNVDMVQRFLSPLEFNANLINIEEDQNNNSMFYVVHPSLLQDLGNCINKARGVNIGNGCRWTAKNSKEYKNIEKKYKIFISYSVKDEKNIQKFLSLINNELDKIRYTVEMKKFGPDISGIQRHMTDTIDECHAFILFLSKNNNNRRKSPAVHKELDRAKENIKNADKKTRAIIPIIIDDLQISDIDDEYLLDLYIHSCNPSMNCDELIEYIKDDIQEWGCSRVL